MKPEAPITSSSSMGQISQDRQSTPSRPILPSTLPSASIPKDANQHGRTNSSGTHERPSDRASTPMLAGKSSAFSRSTTPSSLHARADSIPKSQANRNLLHPSYASFNSENGLAASISRGVTPMLPRGLTPVGNANSPKDAAQGRLPSTLEQKERQRKSRISQIKEKIGTRWGYVSPNGIERGARILGLECLWEDDATMNPHGTGSNQTAVKRQLSIAGNGLLVEIGFEGHRVASVTVDFPESSPTTLTWTTDIARILHNNLTGQSVRSSSLTNAEHIDRKQEIPKQGAKHLRRRHSEYILLDSFMTNLRRLVDMDNAGGANLNCFDAISGIFTALGRVHHSLCQNSGSTISELGRPFIFENDSIDLGLIYWHFTPTAHVASSTQDIKMKDEQAEDGNGPGSNEKQQAQISGDHQFQHRISIKCQDLSALPPASAVHEPRFEWLKSVDPSQMNAAEIDAHHIVGTNLCWIHQMTPDGLSPSDSITHFTALFDPPLVLPLALVMQLEANAGMIHENSVDQATFAELVLPTIEGENQQDLNKRTEQKIHDKLVSRPAWASPLKTRHERRRHGYKLTTSLDDHGRALTALPFHHPMQIAALMPVLRQWAVVSHLLKVSMSSMMISERLVDFSSTQPSEFDIADKEKEPSTSHDSFVTLQGQIFDSLEDELAAFLKAPPPPSAAGCMTPLQIDMSLSLATSLPQFKIQFLAQELQEHISVSFVVGLDGRFEQVAIKRRPDDDPFRGFRVESPRKRNAAEQDAQAEKAKTILELSLNIGTLVEWLAAETNTA